MTTRKAFLAARWWGFAALLLAFPACSDNPANSHTPGYGSAFVFMTDYMSAAIGTFHPDSEAVDVLPVSGVHTDVALRSYRGLVYVIERYGKDAITVLDPAVASLPRANFSTGNASNPQDIVVVSDTKAYVMRLNAANILIIDPQNGDSLGTISLSAYADATDGKPEMVAGVLDNGTLYVLVQLLDTAGSPWSWPPTGPGKVLAVDTRTETVTAAFTLTLQNPVAMVAHDGALYVAGGPYDDITKAGVDRIALPGGAVARLADASALGGRPAALEINPQNNSAWVLVQKAWPDASVYRISLSTGAKADSVSGPSSPSAIAVSPENVLLVSDRSMTQPGLYVFDATSGVKRTGPLTTALPPDAVVFVKD